MVLLWGKLKKLLPFQVQPLGGEVFYHFLLLYVLGNVLGAVLSLWGIFFIL